MADDKPGQSSELTRRVLSAAVLIPAVLLLLWLGGWPFLALLALAAVILAREWAGLMRAGNDMGLIAGLSLAGIGGLAVLGAAGGLAGLFTLSALAFLAAAIQAARARPLTPVLVAYPYLLLPLLALGWLRAAPDYGLLLVLWLVLAVWATDTGAYAAGRGIGGPKLAPRFSPNKTWAGLMGGMAGAALAGLGMGAYLGQGHVPLMLLSAVLAAIAQAGDITESALKRRAGVKDSGTLIPGHGGLLDRVDGLIFACAALALLAILFQLQGMPVSRTILWP
ncbi:phosphatidate cytidylyltransferase [Tepidicaulis sp.]|uniref:phosphatidate cytidylyltransferase n=1 Tax=Tepidicaulis sp. TaxID=1920809 RepID=UPI003B5D02CD